MTPKEALSLLDSAVALVSGNRKDHAAALEAVRVLSQLIDDATKAKDANAELLPDSGGPSGL